MEEEMTLEEQKQIAIDSKRLNFGVSNSHTKKTPC